MTANNLIKLLNEVEQIDLSKQTIALAELRSVLTAVVEHLYFRQIEVEARR